MLLCFCMHSSPFFQVLELGCTVHFCFQLWILSAWVTFPLLGNAEKLVVDNWHHWLSYDNGEIKALKVMTIHGMCFCLLLLSFRSLKANTASWRRKARCSFSKDLTTRSAVFIALDVLGSCGATAAYARVLWIWQFHHTGAHSMWKIAVPFFLQFLIFLLFWDNQGGVPGKLGVKEIQVRELGLLHWMTQFWIYHWYASHAMLCTVACRSMPIVVHQRPCLAGKHGSGSW